MRGGDTQARGPRAVSTAEAGLSLLEVMIALSILLVVALGILPLGLIAVSTTENQGHLAARTTEYSQDKMEQLLTLAYNDAVTDTRVFPSAATGGTGLAIGGSANPNAPVAGYADYLDLSGNVLPSAGNSPPAGWFYRRVWQVSSPFANMKQITVTTIVAHGYSQGRTPQSTLSAMKSFPF
jgi:prepilin-type N-terminal cleavage/methylation domain-containing protein